MSKSTRNNPIGKYLSHKLNKAPVMALSGSWLKDAKEETFCVLLCDGIPMAVAYARAGFTAKNAHGSSALALINSQRIQQRCGEILKARAETAPVQLPEITDMLKRVYAGALHDADYSPAHNAAFSLARLYGLVVDRAQLDVIRRPSREPDAPSEIALSDWIQRLPSIPNTTAPSSYAIASHTIEATAFGSDLDAPRDGRGNENGAPVGPVIGTPTPGGQSSCKVESDEGTGIFPRAEDLF